MDEVKKTTFVGYEYKEVTSKTKMVSFLIDGYKNFGWTVDENIKDISGDRLLHDNVILRLKRNRKLINKSELTRLQRNFEFCLKEIAYLEKSKTAKATMYSLIVGIIGTVFMAGSVFAVTATPTRIVLGIVLALPALAGWVSPYFIYQYNVRQKTEKANLLIEEKEDEIFELCEKGSKLLY